MAFLLLSSVFSLALMVLLLRVLLSCWVLPVLAYHKTKRGGLRGPAPNFPFGNISEMKNKKTKSDDSSSLGSSSSTISHDIHSVLFPYFARWQQSYGKVFIYWLGIEPFLRIADPEFLKKLSSGVMGKSWGKPNVFKYDRKPMFGDGLVMVEGDEWVRLRHVITPAFSSSNLKAMASLMVESTCKMLDKWSILTNSGNPEIDVEREIIKTAGEIIARTSFGVSYENGREVLKKLTDMQVALFKYNRYVGVPFSSFMNPRQNFEAIKLGKEIDSLLQSIIAARKKAVGNGRPSKDLLGLLLEANEVDDRKGKRLTERELIDQCKTFFFGGQETTALALSWTLMLLAINPEWQNQLREEIREVIGDEEIDFQILAGLKKMGWVMNEVLRLYSPAPNAQRQTREDIKVDEVVVPKGTNLWIDVVGMHHDPALWGDDVNEFRPERFRDDPLYGGCKHKMGFLPFGFGGRMCVARNLAMMEYKVVLTKILSRFSVRMSPNYRHAPSIVLSLRPTHGLPLIVEPL
ncbi:cytokinin hydroxylase-like [Mangifera indica]|uniref:cytokinin hydroxylase-like n=1 Tax=Mangifera indica TaxID=29780 RepID=UPI001CFAD273|nr:cytokinin hydroxylase-like [Mangifera indica]